jgi:ribosomal protein S18 acetylase RimI-like enzyme
MSSTAITQNHHSNPAVTFRPGTPDDSYQVFYVFEKSLADLGRRLGSTAPMSIADPEALAKMWRRRQSLYEHLARAAEHFWVAEQHKQIVGFARSVCHDGLRELTELFILPEAQSGGIGRELMARVFPTEGAPHRSIIASADIRAQQLYLKAGVYPRFPIYYFGRAPEKVAVATDLMIEPATATPETLEIISRLDKAIVGHRRETNHTWLIEARQGYLYYRAGEPVGYGYTGLSNGPFALLDEDDFPAVLAHAESQAAAAGRDHFGLEVPMVNRAAVDYLLARNFRLDSFIAILMSNKPFGKFENYIVTSPPFFI